MATHLALALFVILAGFVTSAMTSYGVALLEGREGGYRLSFETISSILWGFIICLVAGPFLTMEASLEFWRKGLLSLPVFSAAVAITMLWSFCTGVFVIQLLVLTGLITL